MLNETDAPLMINQLCLCIALSMNYCSASADYWAL